MYEKEIEAANKLMLQKMQELQEACDMLAMWKLKYALAYNDDQMKAKPVEILPATAKATKVIRYKKTGYNVATLARKKTFLALMRRTTMTMLSFEDTLNFVKVTSEKATFRWCKGLSDVSILGLYQYCKANF